MKNIIKRIINLILLIAIAIGIFIFTKNIPNFLVANKNITNNKSNIQNIEKVEETLVAMPSGVAFEVNSGNLRKYNFADGTYYSVDVPNVSPQIYCAAKGLHLNSDGVTYEEVVELVNSTKVDSYSHNSCMNPRRANI